MMMEERKQVGPAKIIITTNIIFHPVIKEELVYTCLCAYLCYGEANDLEFPLRSAILPKILVYLVFDSEMMIKRPVRTKAVVCHHCCLLLRNRN